MIGSLKQAWLVLILALGFGGTLAAVQISLSPIIEKNKQMKSVSRIPDLVPGADIGESEIVHIEGRRVYQARNAAGEHIGWVLPASGQGYADVIELLVGTNVDLSTITGISVLAQKETPALGDKITHDFFTDQFEGIPTQQPITLDKDGGPIVTITAATISSQSVCDITNKAVRQWKPELKNYEKQ